jgi:hypothetical protein
MKGRKRVAMCLMGNPYIIHCSPGCYSQQTSHLLKIIQTNKMFATDRVEYTNNTIKYTVFLNPQNASLTIKTPIFTKNPNSRFVEPHQLFRHDEDRQCYRNSNVPKVGRLGFTGLRSSCWNLERIN